MKLPLWSSDVFDVHQSVYFRDFVYKLNAENIEQVRRQLLCEVSLASDCIV